MLQSRTRQVGRSKMAKKTRDVINEHSPTVNTQIQNISAKQTTDPMSLFTNLIYILCLKSPKGILHHAGHENIHNLFQKNSQLYSCSALGSVWSNEILIRYAHQGVSKKLTSRMICRFGHIIKQFFCQITKCSFKFCHLTSFAEETKETNFSVKSSWEVH